MFQLVELTGVFNEKGCMEIPIAWFEQTGIRTGEEVRLIYLLEEERGDEDKTKEFLVIREEENVLSRLLKEENAEFKLPPKLLLDANIPMDADLEIVCMDRQILILPVGDRKELEPPEELLAIGEDLGMEKDKVKVVLHTPKEEPDEKAHL